MYVQHAATMQRVGIAAAPGAPVQRAAPDYTASFEIGFGSQEQKTLLSGLAYSAETITYQHLGAMPITSHSGVAAAMWHDLPQQHRAECQALIAKRGELAGQASQLRQALLTQVILALPCRTCSLLNCSCMYVIIHM